MEILYDVRDMAVMGLPEVLRRYAFFRRVFHEMLDLAWRRINELAAIYRPAPPPPPPPPPLPPPPPGARRLAWATHASRPMRPIPPVMR